MTAIYYDMRGLPVQRVPQGMQFLQLNQRVSNMQ